LSAGNGSIVIGGSVERSNIVVRQQQYSSNPAPTLLRYLKTIYQVVEKRQDLLLKKRMSKPNCRKSKPRLKNPNPDETFIARRFRNIKRMAPEIVESRSRH
jgi:hypothetical protein